MGVTVQSQGPGGKIVVRLTIMIILQYIIFSFILFLYLNVLYSSFINATSALRHSIPLSNCFMFSVEVIVVFLSPC